MKAIKLSVFLLIVVNCCFGQGNGQSPSSWEINVSDPRNYVGLALSGGRLGLMPSEIPFRVNSIVLNNVYDKESELGVSKILTGINFANLAMTIDGETVDSASVSHWRQTLNMKEAWLETSFLFRDKAEITYRIYALRNMPYAAVMDIDVKPLKGRIMMTASGIISAPPAYTVKNATFRILKDNEIAMPLLQTTAMSPFGRHLIAGTASFLFNGGESPVLEHREISGTEHRLSFQREIAPGERYNFAWAGAVCTTQDFSDPQNESERMVICLLRDNKEKAIKEHKKLWAELWQGDIIVEGNPADQQDIRLALYHLYAFSRPDAGLSIPPMGLSSTIYNGHIFWDTELWMFPPLLAFHPEIAASLLNYRYNRLDKARSKARNYGYKGAMFPWESDDTGEEATPSWALTGTFEHHITADVGIAFWNYYRVTGDKEWLKETGYPVMKEIADFWVSRAEKNPDGSWSVNNVVGADEFAPNVDDNAFTNGSAKAILRYAVQAASVLGIASPAEWKEVSGNLRFNYMKNGVMMEHSRYNGEIIKQADVNLLAYPLEIVTDPDSILRDLRYYEPRIAAEGPAMGYSILSVLSSRMGDADRAYELFRKSFYPNKRQPFGALAEAAQFNNTYFATGAGGMLQAVLFGFAGLHITDHGIIQKEPCLPRQWKSLTLTGVGKDKATFTVTRK
ncbi:MAG TPA: glycoside hydrolase family 65 protein [Bacteroidales bacterium]|nr:glycoside hydrolase family 65 protein [Bacteroidales bacterium]